MKRKRSFLAMLTAAILALVAIVGCTNTSGTVTSPSTTSSTQQTSKVEATPTVAEVAEPTPEVVEPTEETVEDPTPTETPADAGPVIEGIDFSGFIKFSDSEWDVLQKCTFSETRLLFFDHEPNEGGKQKYKRAQFEGGGYAILKDGEIYQRLADHKFNCMLYTCKQIDEAYLDNGKFIYLKERMSDVDFETWANFFDMIDLGYEGGTEEHHIDITYDDGTSETFTFTITDQ